MLALANGIDKVFVYRESGSAPSMHAAAGVLRDDGSIKPSFNTYGTLIRQFQNVQGSARLIPQPDKNVRLYAWNDNGKTLLTAWAIQDQGEIKMDLGKAHATDAFGFESEVDLSKGVKLSIFPVYIRDFEHPANFAQLSASMENAAGR